MLKKFQLIPLIAIFLLASSLTVKAEMKPGVADEGKIEDVVKKVYPSVVRVEAKNRIRKVATGVVIDRNGHIVTTALITPRDEKITVITHEGKKIDADFLGMDTETHLALIRAKTGDKELIPIQLGKEKELSPGSWIAVVSISPEGSPAFSQGYVSTFTPDTLRLNVWVVRGASGSPVVDREGRMVGLLRGVYSEESPVLIEFRERMVAGSGVVLSRAEAPASGMALAIPVDLVVSVSSEIKEKGKVERGWLGVYISEDEEGRVGITEVEKGSPAEAAKLREGDIILEIDGTKVTGSRVFVYEVRKRKPDQTVTLKLERGGKPVEVKVKLGEYSAESMMEELERKFPRLFRIPEPDRPPRPQELPRAWSWGFESRKYIGVSLNELNRELADYFGVDEGGGLLIAAIREGSPAARAGLKVGDVIVKADGKRLESVSELSGIIQDKKKGHRLQVEFLRDRKMKSAEVEIEEEEMRDLFQYSIKEGGDDADAWDDYPDVLRKHYEAMKIMPDLYSGDLQRRMQRMSEELKVQAEKGVKDVQKLLRDISKKKGIKV